MVMRGKRAKRNMGYHQKLLLVSCLAIIGTGILVGIQKYQSEAVNANLNALTIDALHIATKAQAYYFKPKYLNGGGRSFAGLTSDNQGIEKLFGSPQNVDGTFQILPANNDQSIIIQATGNYDTDEDGQNITVQMIVFPESTRTIIINY